MKKGIAFILTVLTCMNIPYKCNSDTFINLKDNIKSFSICSNVGNVNFDNSVIAKTDDTVYFDANDITILSNATYEQMLKMTKSTPNLNKIAGVFLEAEQEYCVNAIALLSIASLESAYGNSCRAYSENNLTGYAAYTDNSVGESFASWEHCILETAKLLSQEYINPKGKWHTGIGKNLYDINDNYSQDSDWASHVEQIGYHYINKVNKK